MFTALPHARRKVSNRNLRLRGEEQSSESAGIRKVVRRSHVNTRERRSSTKGTLVILGLDRFNDGDERRNASRFHKDGGSDFAVLYVEAEEPHLVEVHDESLGGLCLFVEPHLTLALNQEVDIIYASSIFRGIVRNIRETSSPRRLVGFQCEPIIALHRSMAATPIHVSNSEPV